MMSIEEMDFLMLNCVFKMLCLFHVHYSTTGTQIPIFESPDYSQVLPNTDALGSLPRSSFPFSSS